MSTEAATAALRDSIVRMGILTTVPQAAITPSDKPLPSLPTASASPPPAQLARQVGRLKERQLEHRAHRGAHGLLPERIGAAGRQDGARKTESRRAAQHRAHIGRVLHVLQGDIAPRRVGGCQVESRHRADGKDPLWRPLSGQLFRHRLADPHLLAGQLPQLRPAIFGPIGIIYCFHSQAGSGRVEAQLYALCDKAVFRPAEGWLLHQLCGVFHPLVVPAGDLARRFSSPGLSGPPRFFTGE